MRLVECAVPESAVSCAPLTALRDSHSVTVPMVSRTPDGREVAGFWGIEDGAYYVRERSSAGDAWFRLVDDEPATEAAQLLPALLHPRGARDNTSMRVVYRPENTGGRPTIIGVSPAKSRAR
jgi:hypothetical protein